MEVKYSKLLKDKKVLEEINRHKWLQSELEGYDIGFDKAAKDWLKSHAQAWVDYHMPKAKLVNDLTPSKSSSKSTKKKKS